MLQHFLGIVIAQSFRWLLFQQLLYKFLDIVLILDILDVIRKCNVLLIDYLVDDHFTVLSLERCATSEHLVKEDP